MNWILLVSIVFLIGTLVVLVGTFLLVTQAAKGLQAQFSSLKSERSKRKSLVQDLSGIILGLIDPSGLKNLESQLKDVNEQFKLESGKLALAQAEIETVETRLRELEEVERELESSSIEAAQELDMLRTQERLIAQRNKEIRAELEKSCGEIDRLLAELSYSQSAVERLQMLKQELIESRDKVEAYEEQIAKINVQYLELKKAYDALDIEYAQLYEKQGGEG